MTMRVVLLCVLGALSIGGHAAAQREVSVRGPYVSKEGGTTFPERVGAFQRVAITLYTPDGKNIGVGYNLKSPANPVAATIYVYPARQLLSIGSPRNVVEGARDHLQQMEMDAIIREISSAHPALRIVAQDTTTETLGGRPLRGRHAGFAYEEEFAGKKQPLSGNVWLFTIGKRYLKYRVTCPAANAEKAMQSARELMNALSAPSG